MASNKLTDPNTNWQEIVDYLKNQKSQEQHNLNRYYTNTTNNITKTYFADSTTITYTLSGGKLIAKVNGAEHEVNKEETDSNLYRAMRQQALMTRLEEAKVANNNRFIKEAMEALLEFADIPEATRLIHG